jgi:hypothetical protein
MYFWLCVGMTIWWIAGVLGFYLFWTQGNDLMLADIPMMLATGICGPFGLYAELSLTKRLPKLPNPVLVRAKYKR